MVANQIRERCRRQPHRLPGNSGLEALGTGRPDVQRQNGHFTTPNLFTLRRVCFRWTAEGPEDVEIVDYH
jgi:hypothetical protein